MHKSVFGWAIGLVTLFCHPPLAAQRYIPPPYHEPCFDNFAPTWAMVHGFQGLYLGGNVGFASLRTDSADLDGYFNSISTLTSADINLATGVQLGYDARFCNKVFGIVADWDWCYAKTRFQELPNGTTAGPVDQRIERRLHWFSTIRARGGFTMNDILVYITGGGVVGHFKTKFINDLPTSPVLEHLSFSRYRWGWTAGFGGEFVIWQNWSINAELLYMQFGRHRTTFHSPLRENRLISFDHIDQSWIGRIGLNFHFSLCDYW